MLKKVLIGSMLILALSGCAGLREVKPMPPSAPILESLTINPDGSMCMDRQDSAELLLYVDQLERMNE